MISFRPDWEGHGRSRGCMTPNGWTITPHAWDRMFNPPDYRIPASPKEVDRLITMATEEIGRRQTIWGESVMLRIRLKYWQGYSKKSLTNHIFKVAINRKQRNIITVVKIGKRGPNKDVVRKRVRFIKFKPGWQYKMGVTLNNPPVPSILDLEN